MRLSLSIALVAMLLLVHPTASASGGSYLVDDASVAGPGQCQVESWLRAWSEGGDGVWSVPACGVGPVELGLSLDREQGLPGMGLSPSVKWQLRNGDDRGVGLAIEVNATYQRGRHVASQAYAATTFGLDDARHLMLALNVGVDRQRGAGAHVLEGVGVEYALDDRWSVLAERLWSSDSVTDQGGVRLTLGGSSFDLVLGRDRSNDRSHWINLGWNVDL
jgi:opacity protein-like surface antigen